MSPSLTIPVALLLALAVTAAPTARAADQTILGNQLVVKNPSTYDKRKVIAKAKEVGSLDTIVGDPTAAGATLTIAANGGTSSMQTFPLPMGTSPLTGKPFWSGDAVKGFKYKDSKGENGPVKVAQLRKSGSGVFQIKAVAVSKLWPITVLPPNLGTDGCVRLDVGGGGATYHVRFGADGQVTNDGAKLFKLVKPTAEGTCAPPPTTTTTTTTPTTSTTLCFTDTGDGTIHDTCTGLQWEKKTTTAGLQNVSNTYSWAGCCDGDCSTLANLCQPNAAAADTCAARAEGGTEGCSTCASGTCNVDPFSNGALTTVWDWVNQVNAANFAGHGDWRLPWEGGNNFPFTGAKEMETIRLPVLGCSISGCTCGTSPCGIYAIFGPTASNYWSASTDPYGPYSAWVVEFTSGVTAFDVEKGHGGGYVRAVR